jgi:hypothetical protein
MRAHLYIIKFVISLICRLYVVLHETLCYVFNLLKLIAFFVFCLLVAISYRYSQNINLYFINNISFLSVLRICSVYLNQLLFKLNYLQQHKEKEKPITISCSLADINTFF